MIAILLLILACAAYWLWAQHNARPTSNEPPLMPGAWPIIGHALTFIGDTCKFWTTISTLAEQSYDVGGVVAAKVGPRTVYSSFDGETRVRIISCTRGELLNKDIGVVTDPDDMYTVANTCLEKDDLYDFAKPWLGEGLVTAKLYIWKNHRKILNPAFSQIVLDRFMGVFNSQSRKLVDDLDKEAAKGNFDHWLYTRNNTLETICLTALGVDFTDSLLNNKYLEASEQIFNSLVERFTKLWWHSSYIFRFSNLKKKQDACLKIVHKVSDTVLQKRKTEFDGDVCAERSKVSGTRFKAFMDLLLELSLKRDVLTDKEIREHVDTIIVGGSDTSANVLMYTMLLLGSHPEVQEKAYAELKEVLGDEDKDVEKQDLSQLVYLEAVIKESMRIYTIVPVLGRKLDRDVKLKNCTLLSGRTCFLFVFGLHRHPIWGPDRNEFNPDRWLDPSRLPENPNSFAAFSFGRRMCIGKAYAMMSMKTTLAHVLRRYRITADNSHMKLKMDVMLKPVHGHYISIERRTPPV